MKKFTKGIVTLLAGCSMLFALTGCQNKSKEQAQQAQKLQREKKDGQDESLPSGNYFQEDQQHKVVQKQQQQAIKSVSSQMGQNYKKIANVSSHQNAIITTLKGQQMSTLDQAIQQGNPSAKKFASQLTKGLQATSTNISKQIKDPTLQFQLRNTHNQVIYQVHNGRTDIKKV